MTEPAGTMQNDLPTGRVRWVAAVSAVVVLAMVALVAAGFYLYYPSTIGPAQPIAFSHRFHVSEKKLSCVMCHTGVFDSERAGIPPLETCMLCHNKIIVHYPEIEKLRTHYAQSRPIEWVRVNQVPDLCYFSHRAHTRRGFDCGRCHGDVSGMDRVEYVIELKMGFCIQCHRDEGASHDCLTCHR